jgi:hypothetical protein
MDEHDAWFWFSVEVMGVFPVPACEGGLAGELGGQA